MKVYTYHLSEAKAPTDIEKSFIEFCQEYEIIFHNENSFSVKNEDGLYLTAFDDGEIKFYATKCDRWERFYILDDDIETLVKFAQNRLNQSCRLFISNHRIHVLVDKKVITPSFIPPARLKQNEWSIEYSTLSGKTKLQVNKPLIYLCIYGKEKYYECFYLTLRSLIEKGKYKGDILIKTDNIEKVGQFCQEFDNHFIFSEIDKELGIFNRYWLHEDCLSEYSSLIYLDSDILTLRDISEALLHLQQGDLATFIDGEPSFEKVEHYFNQTGNFPTYKWYGMQYIDKDYVRKTKEVYVLNSGFWAINNFEKVKPIMDKIVQYRFLESTQGDQPFFNVSLYNSDVDIKIFDHTNFVALSHSNYESFTNLDKVFIHYNIGVGYMSKLDFMKETWEYINKN